jgi:hypothetical protein
MITKLISMLYKYEGPLHVTLDVAFSRPNSKALATHVVLAHPRMAFYPYTCGLHRVSAVVIAMLIGYDDVEVTVRTTTRRRRSWLTTFSTPKHDYVRSLFLLFLRCSTHLVVTIHDLILTSILGWHGRSSASVVYPFPYSGIRVVLCSSWSRSCTMVIYDGY